IGYLLPTREQVMEGRPEAAPLLALAERAEDLGYDSIWVGDSILARPRHEPLTLLSAVAARTRHSELGTAVLLPALRNPVVQIGIGYLLPTREQVMEGRPEAAPLLALAERAEDLGYDSIWVGDSILARPRHEPLTLLSAVAARTRHSELGTAVLLPALRNPVVLAH